MCNACVINNVKSSMLSRRDFFRRSAAVGIAATAAGAISARPALAQSTGTVTDLTWALDGDFPTFDGLPGIMFEEDKTFDPDGYKIWKVTFFEHSGTHIDAPLHFSEDGTSVDELDPSSLVCPLCIIDIKSKAADDPNAMLEPEDIEAFISANGDIPEGACVAMNSGWADKMGEEGYRNDADGNFTFPGFAKSATDMLSEMGVAAIGVDTLSLDPGNSADFAVHYSWLPSGHYGIENLANLDQLPATGATLFVGAPKHKGGTGGPARILALT
ncbi:cyclase family protein [Pelagovum pacificum]|uniref:Cyclase family protein n=1 Tax=Pelagovum pacificum TaxID=2588711 RepID=A0A5C5GB73_9RHOB|nr:cyclase family protein [Pelagovum pacificum]QQA42232.1 cyclase family protein [Pelagovum pacificum]TNY31317.1 cyclase family protein [Pelagovum pacificum]